LESIREIRGVFTAGGPFPIDHVDQRFTPRRANERPKPSGAKDREALASCLHQAADDQENYCLSGLLTSF
jgi:hypothetical protein